MGGARPNRRDFETRFAMFCQPGRSFLDIVDNPGRKPGFRGIECELGILVAWEVIDSDGESPVLNGRSSIAAFQREDGHEEVDQARVDGRPGRGLGVVLSGCSEESESRSEPVIRAPDGRQTKVIKEVTVEKSGDNPPPVTKTP